ncbi:MAG: hypothetical protein ACQKBT_01405 [Puniceicoccales bacterium]
MHNNPYKQKVQVTVGWLLFALGILGAIQILVTHGKHPEHTGALIGQMIGPLVFSVLGLYLAGVFTNRK